MAARNVAVDGRKIMVVTSQNKRIERNKYLPKNFKTDYDRIYLVDPFCVNRIKEN